VPASAALVVTAYYLYRRRARALLVAIALMVALTVFDLVKGLDIEGAALTLGCAALLWASRSSFSARHEPGTVGSAFLRVPLLLVAAFVGSLAVVALAAPKDVSTVEIVRETGDLLLWQPGPFGFQDELARTGLAVELVSLLSLLTVAYVIFRPLAAPRDLPDAELRHAAADIVRRHGTDTLSFFKLRADKHYLFDPSKAAFVGYRIDSGVLMISGDPVGDASAVEELTRSVVSFAEARSLRIAALGVSPAGREVFEQAGLRALYLGDEAIVDTDSFSLEGRGIRKVRQSVARLDKAGYRARLTELGQLEEYVVAELEEIASTWLHGAPERGFSMAMDSLRNPLSHETLVLYGIDPDGAIGGFLQFVPTYGRNAVSLSFMRRRTATPNGLTEFLVVETLAWARDTGASELSLNFCALTDFLAPERVTTPAQRVARRGLLLADNVFQLERLYSFNRKFFPAWRRRYICVERLTDLPAVGLAYLHAESLLVPPGPWPRRRRLASGRRAA
jgi:lysyl-tRNA synthetase class 2